MGEKNFVALSCLVTVYGLFFVCYEIMWSRTDWIPFLFPYLHPFMGTFPKGVLQGNIFQVVTSNTKYSLADDVGVFLPP